MLGNNAAELAVNKQLTRIFIEDDPVTVQLIPHGRHKTASGAYKTVPGIPKPPQTVKLIYQGGSADGIVETGDGALRKYDFVLLAEYDADVEIGDVFYEEGKPNQKWVVRGLQPFNGYEIKAGIVSYGDDPDHG